jgi:hypothetical protein
MHLEDVKTFEDVVVFLGNFPMPDTGYQMQWCGTHEEFRYKNEFSAAELEKGLSARCRKCIAAA